MINTSLQLTNSTSKYLMKMLDNVQMKDRDAVWNQIYRDVRRSNDIWSKIDRENKLNIELAKNKSRLSPINKI